MPSVASAGLSPKGTFLRRVPLPTAHLFLTRPPAFSTPAAASRMLRSPSSLPTAIRSAPSGLRYRRGALLHLRFNDLTEPSPVPRDTDFSSVFESDVPIVVQHTRLDSRHAEVSLLSTTAYGES